MRIAPLVKNYNNFSNNKAGKVQAALKNNNNSVKNHAPHKYSGVASADLAYASMFDNAIAQDLKLMGLI